MVSADVTRQKYPFTLPDLPYAYDALEPHLDQKTLQLHHREHHATYVKKLNEALAKEETLQQLTLAQLLRDPDKLPPAVRTAVINNGGGHLLHDLFWNSLAPAPAKAPSSAFGKALNDSFGSLEDFRKKFSAAAAGHFASGWVALTVEHATRKLAIEALKDHTVPRPGDKTAVLILDVWEHAYYLKFQNRRPEFIEAFWNVANWAHADELFVSAKAAA
ncbi:MAG: superoxide dismutase [Pseudomonadota bacterium]